MNGNFKRSSFLFFWVEDTPLFDAASLLRGQFEFADRIQLQIYAGSPLTEARYPVTLEQVRLMAQLPSDSWTQASEADAESLQTLARQGLVLSDSDEVELSELRKRHELLKAQHWHPYSAFYHFMSRERQRNARLPSAKAVSTERLAEFVNEDAVDFVERFGPPPNAFHHIPNGSQSIDLPLIEKAGGLYDALLKRRTSRAFESDVPLKLEDLAVLLYYVFGCQGSAQLAPGFSTLHKTSASGGSLHPIEAYPLVLNVDTLAPGFYHYNVESHSLTLIRQIERTRARDLAFEIGDEQSHAREAHVLVAITVRFRRNYWKYRQRSLAYNTLHLDAGHLSQTFYLVAAELNLAVFFSAAIDAARVEKSLGLQPQEESALALWGCGVKATDGPDLGLEFEPYIPRKVAN